MRLKLPILNKESYCALLVKNLKHVFPSNITNGKNLYVNNFIEDHLIKGYYFAITCDKTWENLLIKPLVTCFFFFYIFMTYNLQRKIKFTITRYIKNIYTWEKNKNKKSNNISEYLAIFLHYNTQQLFLYKRTVKPFTQQNKVNSGI